MSGEEAASRSPENPRVTVIVPAYNEALTLKSMLTKMLVDLPGYEILLVNDGSTDDTAAVVRRLAAAPGAEGLRYIEYHPNRGKGYAIRVGMLSAQGDLLVFTDADLPFGTAGVQRIAAALEHDDTLDIAIAAKKSIPRGAAYRVARMVARQVIGRVTGLCYPDTQAGLKGFRREAARVVFRETHVDGFAADVEMLYLAKLHGFTVRSLVMAVSSAYARPSTFSPLQGFRILADVFKMRFTPYAAVREEKPKQ